MRTILIYLTLLISNLNISQTDFDFNPYEYGKFKISGQAYCGVGNAYCCITRSQYPNQFGNFIYQIYLTTNSYMIDCSPCKTYIPNIEVMYCDNQKGIYYYPKNFYKFWVTVGQTNLVYTLYHPNPNLFLKIRTGYMQPTIY